MAKKIFFTLVMLLLLLQITTAMDTEIKIKTLPDHRVMISALNLGETYSLIESFHKDSGASGEVSVTLSCSADNFNLAVWVKKENNVIIHKKFEEEYPAGFPVTIELYPDWYDKPEEETINSSLDNETYEEIIINETQVIITEETEQENVAMTGSAVFGEEGLSNKTIYYVIGGIILLVVGFFLAKKIKKKSKIPKEIKIKKLSELKAEKKEDLQDNNKIIEDAERKIKEAQEEIRKIKNQGKIEEAKKKIIEDEKELMRLREGKE